MLPFLLILPVVLFLPLVWVLVRQRRALDHQRTNQSLNGGDDASSLARKTKVYGFFHPYCSGGGGGERVLWKMIQVLQQQQQGIGDDETTKVHIVIFTVDPPETDEARLRADAQKRFDVTISHPVQLVSLEAHKHYLNPSPYLSLVLESWGTMKLAYHALRLYYMQASATLDVFCDTTGCAFTFLVVKWLLPACQILAYVHYPTISTDMMSWEWNQSSKSVWKRQIKLIYFAMFAMAYGLVGSLADLVMVNSTWTYNHIRRLWRWCSAIDIVYPPCRIAPSRERIQASPRKPVIVSIGQFRPEKDHRLQIESFAFFLRKYGNISDDKKVNYNIDDVRLWLIGSCRNEQDQARVEELRQFVSRQLSDVVDCEDSSEEDSKVVFKINLPYVELESCMQTATIGIHTMRQEHFGIGIVEMMSAGLITIAHNSGGPRTDIIEPNVTGYLATTPEEYADFIHQALTMNPKNANEMREMAQLSSERFSDIAFEKSLQKSLAKLK